jgi:hypothetical protein
MIEWARRGAQRRQRRLPLVAARRRVAQPVDRGLHPGIDALRDVLEETLVALIHSQNLHGAWLLPRGKKSSACGGAGAAPASRMRHWRMA